MKVYWGASRRNEINGQTYEIDEPMLTHDLKTEFTLAPTASDAATCRQSDWPCECAGTAAR